MNFFRKISVTHGAREDARLGLDSIDERIVSDLGPRPKVDPVGNPEHATFVSALGDRSKMEELRDDVTQAEDAYAKHAPPILFTLGLVVAVVIELVGATLIMRLIGVTPGERLPLALALALALIGITAVMASRAAAVSGAPPSDGTAVKIKSSLWTLVVLFLYSAFVCAIAVVRIQGTTDDGASQIEVVAQALLMVATSIAPAWATEALMRRRAPTAALRKRLGILRTRLSEAVRGHARAQKAVNEIAREGARWDVEAARRRAQYQTNHRLEVAKGRTA